MSLRVAIYNAANWKTYLGWFEERGVMPPITMPKQAIMVADDEELLGGICVYMTDGPWMFLEHMQLKPGLSAGTIRRVIKFGLEAAKGMGAIVYKAVVIHEQREAIAHFLQDTGYVLTPASVWYGIPDFSPIKNVPQGQTGENPKGDKKGDDELDSNIQQKKKKSKSVGVCISCGVSFIRTDDTELCPDCTPAPATEKPRKKKRVGGRRKKDAKPVDKGTPSGDE
jgi:hypothetical protein